MALRNCESCGALVGDQLSTCPKCNEPTGLTRRPAGAVVAGPPDPVTEGRNVVVSSATPYRTTATLSRVLQAIFVLWVGLAGVALGLDWVTYQLVSRQLDNPLAVSFETVGAHNDQRSIIAWVVAGATLLTGIVFITWMRRLLLNLPSLGSSSSWTPGWAIGAWCVPILNLFRPKQIMDDIWRGSEPDVSAPPATVTIPPLLNWWWGLWIAGGVAGSVVNVWTGDWIETRAEALALVATGAGLLASAILTFWVVTRLTARQDQRAERVAADVGAGPAIEDVPVRREGQWKPWQQGAVLPVLAVIAMVVGYSGFQVPSDVTTVDPVESAGAAGMSRYANYGVAFDYPAGMIASEMGMLSDEADRTSGVAAAASFDGSRAWILGWIDSLGNPPGRNELVRTVDSAVDTVGLETGADVRSGDLQETVVNGHLFIFREWSGVLEGERGNGIAAAGSCDGRAVIVQLLATESSAEAVRTDFETLIESLTCEL